MGRHLDIDFCAILVDLGSQVGKENETKIKIKKGQNLKGFLVGGGAGHVGEEFSPSLVGGIPYPRTQDPGGRASLEILVATFLAISLLFFFPSFFEAFLGRSWLQFPSQLASQNQSKSKKSRCQDAIHLGLRFLIDFWSVLAPNFHARKPTKR